MDRFVIVSIFIPKLRLILILNSFLGSSDSLVFSELFHSLAPRPLAARSISDFLLTYLATQTALASIKLIQASAVLDLTEDDFDFLTSNKVWIATDRSRARRCVEACVYGTLDFVGYPRFPAPVEFI